MKDFYKAKLIQIEDVMKHNKMDALNVISVFQQSIPQMIIVKNYSTVDFFHKFEIEPIEINGYLRKYIFFKDSLIEDIINNRFFNPDINNLIDSCFR